MGGDAGRLTCPPTAKNEKTARQIFCRGFFTESVIYETKGENIFISESDLSLSLVTVYHVIPEKSRGFYIFFLRVTYIHEAGRPIAKRGAGWRGARGNKFWRSRLTSPANRAIIWTGKLRKPCFATIFSAQTRKNQGVSARRNSEGAIAPEKMLNMGFRRLSTTRESPIPTGEYPCLLRPET
jgi:hypothetical protein